MSGGVLFPPEFIGDSLKAPEFIPGFTVQYSKPRDLMTSIMKSEPGRSGGNDAGLTEASSAGLATTASAFCVCALALLAPSAPTPPAAIFRKSRRSYGFFGFFSDVSMFD